MSSGYTHALMRYKFAVDDGWSTWSYKVMNKKAYIYCAAKHHGGRCVMEVSEWEIVCDDQTKHVLLTMLELAKEEQATND